MMGMMGTLGAEAPNDPWLAAGAGTALNPMMPHANLGAPLPNTAFGTSMDDTWNLRNQWRSADPSGYVTP